MSTYSLEIRSGSFSEITCPINKSQIKSLDFALNSVFRKILVIKSYDVANKCIVFSNCSVSDAIYKRKKVSDKIAILGKHNNYANYLKKNISDELAVVLGLMSCVVFIFCCISLFYINYHLVNKDGEQLLLLSN